VAVPMVAGRVLFGFGAFALGGLLFGYSIGITGNLLQHGQLLCCRADDACAGLPVTEDTGAGFLDQGYSLCYDLTTLQQGVLSSLTLVGAVVGSLICFRFADALGRKREALIGSLLYAFGSGLAALAPSLLLVCAGLTIYGVGIGLAMHAAPLYIAEIAPAEVRGALVSAKEAVIVLGIFLGFASGLAFQHMEHGWRGMIGCATLLALGMGGSVAALPRSPRWLAFRAAQASQGDALLPAEGYVAAARDALTFYRPGLDACALEAELSKILEDARTSVGATKASWSAPFQYPRCLVIGCGLVLFQQITGQPSVLYEATPIFQSAGFSNAAALSSTGVGFVKLLATLFTVWRVDRYGRVFLLKVGISMMLFSLLLVAVGFLYRECAVPVPIDECPQKSLTLPSAWAAVVVTALMVYVSGYQVGFGPIAWLMISEVFPLKVRGPAMSLACLLNFGANIVMTSTLSSLMEALTPPGVFFLYTGLTALALGFVATVVPETKGKTLEEIEQMLH